MKKPERETAKPDKECYVLNQLATLLKTKIFKAQNYDLYISVTMSGSAGTLWTLAAIRMLLWHILPIHDVTAAQK